MKYHLIIIISIILVTIKHPQIGSINIIIGNQLFNKQNYKKVLKYYLEAERGGEVVIEEIAYRIGDSNYNTKVLILYVVIPFQNIEW